MHREGHIGAALALYAPIGFLVYIAGLPAFGIGGGIGAVLLAMVPDQDMRVPFVSHRGITHTVWFALLIGGILGATAGYLASETATEGPLAIGAFAFTVGFVTIISHIVADALTPMGVTPFVPLSGQTYTISVAAASNPIANYALLFLGAALAGGALYLATTVPG